MKHGFRYKVETGMETGMERESSENEEARRVAGLLVIVPILIFLWIFPGLRQGWRKLVPESL